VLFEGAQALATSLNDAGPVRDARAASSVLIEASVPQSPGPKSIALGRVTSWAGWRQPDARVTVSETAQGSPH